MSTMHTGVSVIIPTHSGVERLPSLIESLQSQTLDTSLWEVIFVHNGEDDGSLQLLHEWQRTTEISSRVFHVPNAGASIARNVGLATARHSYITFVDDDDDLQVEFLQAGLDVADATTIGLLPIRDQSQSVGADLGESIPGSLYLRIAALRGKKVPLSTVPWVLGFNACKFVPAKYLQDYRYDQSLQSGEDVAFFAQLIQHPELHIAVPRLLEDTAYIRRLRSGSVSRKAQSFDFSVAQRLDVIESLRSLRVAGLQKDAVESLVKAQFGFTVSHLTNYPNDYALAAEASLERGLGELPWAEVNKHQSRSLVFSFCFPPYADPAANVVAKRIAERKDFVDVISADMTPVRELDPTSSALVEPWVVKHVEVAEYPSFASWDHIAKFALKTVRSAKGSYKSLYSRALWSGSHVAGCLYKLKHPHIYWEAEFSDPLCFDSSGNRRIGEITRNGVTAKLCRAIKKAGWEEVRLDSHFALTELATFLLANKLSFSNENQLNEVLKTYPRALQQLVRGKSIIAPQPVPPPAAYDAVPVAIQICKDSLNIGYFGSFYANRGLNDLIAAASSERIRAQDVTLHLFTKNAEEVRKELAVMDVGIRVQVYEALPYLKFLNAARQCDVLVVADADTTDSEFSQNPFLPSKLSDYIGTGVPVWAIVEPGSPLDQCGAQYKSILGDQVGAEYELLRMMGSIPEEETQHRGR